MLGRERAIDLLDLGVRRRRHGSAVAPDQHERGAENDFAPVHACAPSSELASQCDLGDVLDAYRHRPTRCDDSVLDVRQALDAAAGAHDVAFAVSLDIIRAPADIVGFDRFYDLAERNPIGDQACRIGLHLVLLDVAADGIGAGHTGHGLHLRPDDPILDRAQIDGALELVGEALAFRRQIRAIALPTGLAIAHRRPLAGRRVFDRPPIDFSQSGRDRAHLHVDARRQICLDVGDALDHLLAGEVDVGLVGEDGSDLGETVARERTGGFEARRARERRFDRIRDLLLDLDWRQRRSDGVDLDLDIGHVRHGIDRKLGQRPGARNRGSERNEQDEPAAVDRECENTLHHPQSSAAPFMNSALSGNVLVAAMISPG